MNADSWAIVALHSTRTERLEFGDCQGAPCFEQEVSRMFLDHPWLEQFYDKSLCLAPQSNSHRSVVITATTSGGATARLVFHALGSLPNQVTELTIQYDVL
jgi:hypothetical protein